MVHCRYSTELAHQSAHEEMRRRPEHKCDETRHCPSRSSCTELKRQISKNVDVLLSIITRSDAPIVFVRSCQTGNEYEFARPLDRDHAREKRVLEEFRRIDPGDSIGRLRKTNSYELGLFTPLILFPALRYITSCILMSRYFLLEKQTGLPANGVQPLDVGTRGSAWNI